MGCNSSNYGGVVRSNSKCVVPYVQSAKALVDLEDVLHIDGFHSSKGPQCLQLLDTKVRDSQRTDTAEIHQVLHVPAKLGLNSLNPGETGEHD